MSRVRLFQAGLPDLEVRALNKLADQFHFSDDGNHPLILMALPMRFNAEHVLDGIQLYGAMVTVVGAVNPAAMIAGATGEEIRMNAYELAGLAMNHVMLITTLQGEMSEKIYFLVPADGDPSKVDVHSRPRFGPNTEDALAEALEIFLKLKRFLPENYEKDLSKTKNILDTIMQGAKHGDADESGG